jgi:hypothetical protein
VSLAADPATATGPSQPAKNQTTHRTGNRNDRDPHLKIRCINPDIPPTGNATGSLTAFNMGFNGYLADFGIPLCQLQIQISPVCGMNSHPVGGWEITC